MTTSSEQTLLAYHAFALSVSCELIESQLKFVFGTLQACSAFGITLEILSGKVNPSTEHKMSSHALQTPGQHIPRIGILELDWEA